MTRGTAESYWAATAESYFDGMGSTYRPGERTEAPMPQARRSLPPLMPSKGILDAIAACQPARRQPTQPAKTRSLVAIEGETEPESLAEV